MDNIPFGNTTNCFPEVFNTVPVQPKQEKPGQLTATQIKQFFDDGYVIIHDYFDHALLEEAKKAIEEQVDGLAQLLFDKGRIEDTYKEYGLYKRLTKLEHDVPAVSSVLISMGYLSDSFKKIWSNERILNAMEQLLGTEDIQGNPVWNLRTKTPQTEAFTVPWHQDVGYMDNDSHSVLQVTAWIPLINATAENGCLQVLKGGHKKGRVVPHQGCWRSTHYVESLEEDMQQLLDIDVEKNTVTCEIPFGSMLLLSNMIPHQSLPNMSNDIRWSLDFRWQRTDQPVGFHGLKEGVEFRSSTNPNMKIDWEKFNGNPTWDQVLKSSTQNGEVWDPLMPGPWMAKWKITNKNKHVMAFEKSCSPSGNVKQALKWHSHEDYYS